MKEVEDLKKEYNYNLAAKNLAEPVNVTLYGGESVTYKPPTGTEENFILRPNPIMRLDRVIGWHPNYNSGSVFFN